MSLLRGFIPRCCGTTVVIPDCGGVTQPTMTKQIELDDEDYELLTELLQMVEKAKSLSSAVYLGRDERDKVGRLRNEIQTQTE